VTIIAITNIENQELGSRLGRGGLRNRLFDTSFFKTFEESIGKKWLSGITDATGGRTITVDSIDKMADAATTISRELRSQYVLGYRPSNALSDGKRRQIKVHVINSSASTVQLQAYL